MRNNQPVTQIEHKMKPDDILVSRTDLKGRIVYVNKAFCEIAGFTLEELQGKPHNLIRHPDMPASAFQDLWETISEKKPWTGMVKNRCKNGDYYWVIANVSPEYNSNGNISGYISVRTSPTQAQIDATETLYREVNAGKATLPSTLKASWFKKIKLKTIMLTTAATALTTLFALGYLFINILSLEKSDTELRVAAVPIITSVRHVLEFIPQHRGMSNAYLNGKTELAAKLSNNEQKVDTLLQSFSDMPELALFPEFQDELATIKQQWNLVKQQWKHAAAKQSFSMHTAVIDGLMTLSSSAMHQGKITTDSSIDIAHLAKFISETIPNLNEHMGHLRGLGTGIITKGSITTAQRDTLLELYVKAISEREGLFAEIEHLIQAYNPDLRSPLSASVATLSSSSSAYLSYVRDKVIDAQDISSSNSMEYFAAGTQAITASLSLFDVMESSLRKLLAEESQHVSSTYYLVISLLCFGIIFSLLLSILMIRNTFKPLQEIVDGMQRLVEADYHTQPVKHNFDELGDIADDMKTLQSVLQYEIFEGKTMAAESLETQRLADIEKSRLQSELANAFEDNVGSLVSELASGVEQVNSAAIEIDALADTLNAQSENTLQSVQTGSAQINTTAAAMEEMSITIQSVSQEISKTQDISTQAVIEAQNATTMMVNLSNVASEIGSIVGAISDIAEQTNLLALNASIEAARAGDAGRGFSVVAGEVKELANQTSLATNKIRKQVEGIQSESQSATQAIKKIGQTIKDINNFTSNIVESMEQQSEAGREISQASQEAGMSMNSANHSVESLADSASKVDKSSDDMITVAKSMAQSTADVQRGIQEFLETLRKN